MTKKKDNIIRIGDRVKCITPMKFIRCGYSPSFQELYEQVENEEEARIREFLGQNKFRDDLTYADSKAFSKVVSAIAYMKLHETIRAGKKRELILEQCSHFQDPQVGSEGEVIARKVVKTGTYNADRSCYDGYSGCYDYDPAYLSDEKTHVVLRVEFDRADEIWILKEHVEKLEISDND